MSSMIRNIVFDMGKVLIHWDPDMFMDHYNLTAEDRMLLRRELFGSIEWVQLDRGAVSEETALESVCKRLPERLHAIAWELATDWWKWPIVPMEGIEDLIRELKGNGYAIYLLSNANRPLRAHFSRLPGADCFSGMVISAEEKVIKPQPEIYKTLYSRYNLVPEESVFIDDLSVNCEGAVNTGMNAIVFRADVAALRKDLRRMGLRCHE